MNSSASQSRLRKCSACSVNVESRIQLNRESQLRSPPGVSGNDVVDAATVAPVGI